MLKRNAIVKFVFLTIIAILGILLCVCPFSVPYSSNQYNGFVKSINKGVDLQGGVTAVYECTLRDGEENLSDAIDNSLSKIESVFKSERFSQLFVERHGGNQVYIMASDDAYKMNKAFYYIEDGKTLNFTTAKVSESLSEVDVYLDSNDLKSVKPDYNYESSAYGVTIEFSKEGFANLKKLKDIANKTSDKMVYVYLGDVEEKNFFAEFSASSIKEDTMFLKTASDSKITMTSDSQVREIAYNIAGGMLSVDLKLNEVSDISPVLGKNTQLYIGICLILTIVISFILLCARYGEFGLVGSLALVFNLIFFTFLLQAIPFLTLTLAGVVGSIAAYLLSCFAIVAVFENIRDEYAVGKKLYLACKGGFKKALWPIVDSHVISIFIAIFIWVIAPSTIKSFGIVLLVGTLISMFISLLLLRWFVSIYLKINSTKAKKLRFKRDKNYKENLSSTEVEPEVEVITPEEAVNE